MDSKRESIKMLINQLFGLNEESIKHFSAVDKGYEFDNYTTEELEQILFLQLDYDEFLDKERREYLEETDSQQAMLNITDDDGVVYTFQMFEEKCNPEKTICLNDLEDGDLKSVLTSLRDIDGKY